jgi:hypothetical protein
MQPLSAAQLFHDADGAAAFAAADHEDRSRARRRVAEMVRRAAGRAELTRRRACAQLERDVLPPIREREEVRGGCALTPRMRGRVSHDGCGCAAKGSAEPRARPPGPQRGEHPRRRYAPCVAVCVASSTFPSRALAARPRRQRKEVSYVYGSDDERERPSARAARRDDADYL